MATLVRFVENLESPIGLRITWGNYEVQVATLVKFGEKFGQYIKPVNVILNSGKIQTILGKVEDMVDKKEKYSNLRRFGEK